MTFKFKKIINFSKPLLGLFFITHLISAKAFEEDIWYRLVDIEQAGAPAEIDDRFRDLFYEIGIENNIKLFNKALKDDDFALICAFSGRYVYLQSNELLKNNNTDLSDICPSYKLWSQESSITEVSLIYATGYFGNPASFFGHTLLKFGNNDSSSETPFYIDNTLNYGANTFEDSGLIYLYKGLTGKYKARYTVEQFSQQIYYYSELEHRDFYSYELNLTQKEIDLISALSFQLIINSNEYNYYFLSDNCANKIMELISLFSKNNNLTPAPWVSPYEIMYFVGNDMSKGLNYYPSIEKSFLFFYEKLTKREKNYFKRILQSKNIEFDDLDNNEISRIISALIYYIEYKEPELIRRAKLQAKQQNQNLRKNLLLFISNNSIRLEKPVIKGNSPHLYNASNKLIFNLSRFQNNFMNEGNYVDLSFDGSAYDNLDNLSRGMEFSKFSLLSPTLRIGRDYLKLLKIDFLDIESLTPGKIDFEPKINWTATLKYLSNDYCEYCGGIYSDIFIGRSFNLTESSVFYLLGGVKIFSNENLDYHDPAIRYGYIFNNDGKISFKISRDISKQNNNAYASEIRYKTNRNRDISLKYFEDSYIKELSFQYRYFY